jgi:Protein of unknown function (DUF2905)
MGRTVVIAGLVIAAIGAILMLSERFNLPLGRLPGDITWKGRNTTVYFPLVTSVLASLALSALLWLFNRR